MMDYNEEARKLWARLDDSKVGRFNNLDAMYKSEAGGFIYVGGDLAARDLSGLQARGITSVVNCTTNIECFHKGTLDYFTFDIACWRRLAAQAGKSAQGLVKFLKPVLEFINDVINRGESVLVHCLAGAHRAGTTGIICLMHFEGLVSREAVLLAQSRRPIIEPIGDFRDLLGKCDQLPRDAEKKLKF
eukprot:GFUD01036043.1.p1 GENE.GFUD01036043.1~~GFUD01036043.1.p1  ORF type:complete len:188 (-),score=42.48 GFUD01036043.1:158-721(-)